MKPHTLPPRWKTLLCINTAAAAAAGIYALLARLGFGLPCLLRRFTGLMCPGCGNSRAALSLLRLDFGAVLEYNLLFPLEVGYLAWLWVHCCISCIRHGRFAYTPPWPVLDVCVLIAIIAWGILRNFL